MPKNISYCSNRWEQMNKQEQLIFQKKREIEERLKNDTQVIEPNHQAETKSYSKPSFDTNVNKFENDGSFLERFRKMQEEAKSKAKDSNELR